ncbi:MAG: hypothetical protein ABFS28_00740 [Bacteroidota bacterium]
MRKIATAIVICFTFFSLPTYGQTSSDDRVAYANLIRKEYGLNHELINGEQYYNRYSRTKGHPYFLDERYRTGSLTLEGRVYEELGLRFDIHSQHVELQYRNFSGGDNQIITVADNVDAFTIGKYQFRKLELEHGPEKFYQVLSTDCFTCYILWKKDLLPLNGSFTYIEQFSTAKRSLWLDLNGELHAFHSRKDFSGLFPEEYHKEIKRFLSKNQFKFRTASVDEIIRNVEAVCNLLKEKANL